MEAIGARSASAAHQKAGTSANTEAKLRAQLARESHNRWLLLQRLNVLERKNADLKATVVAAVELIRPDDDTSLIVRSNDASKDGGIPRKILEAKDFARHCLAISRSSAHIREIIAKILAQKEVIACRLQHLSDLDCTALDEEISRIALQPKTTQNGPADLELIFEEFVRSKSSTSPSKSAVISWDCQPMKLAKLMAESSALTLATMVQYIELNAWHQACRQAMKLSPAMGSDPSARKNFGFTFMDGCNLYTFDEPETSMNICYMIGTPTESPQIKSATLEKAIEKLSTPGSTDHMGLQQALFTCMPKLTNPFTLLDLILQRFNLPPAPNVTPPENDHFQKLMAAPIQARCLDLLRFWIDQFPEDLTADSSVAELFQQHMKDIIEIGDACNGPTVQGLLDLFHSSSRRVRPAAAPALANAVREPGSAIAPFKRKIDSFSQVHNGEFVRLICRDDASVFVKLRAREFINRAWSKVPGDGSPSKAPHILAMVARFNRMSSFVQMQILGQTTRPNRIAMVQRFIKLAEDFRSMRNYNAVFAISAGLNTSAIHRLKQTWDGLPKRSMAAYNTLRTLVSVNNNSRAFRDEMKNIKPPCVPHLGLMLQDLTFIDDGNPDRALFGMINFHKMTMTTEKISWIMECQRCPYQFDSEPSSDLISFVNREFVVVTDDMLWERSQLVEPRKAT